MRKKMLAVALAFAGLFVSAPLSAVAVTPMPSDLLGLTVERAGPRDDGVHLKVGRYFNKCLDADANGGGNGTKVQLWDCNRTHQQTWIYTRIGQLLNVKFNKCLDVDLNGGGGNGTKVQLWDCHDGDNQAYWISGLTYRSIWAHGRCLDADTNGGGSNGSKVQVWDCNGEGQQNWTPIPYA